MKDDIDFAALYNALGLTADCSIATLKQAYRRRVRDLHPDLPGATGSVEQLQRLNRLYTAALDFERRHGRLPGAPRAPSVRRGAPLAAAMATPAATVSPSHLDAPQADPEIMSASRPWLRYVLVLGLSGIVLFWLAPRHEAEPVLHTAASFQPSGAHAAVDPTFELGTDRATVRRLQGAPFNDDDALWSYGPSWIEFRCGKVSNWYSSPLHPLRARKASPDAGDVDASAARQQAQPRC